MMNLDEMLENVSVIGAAGKMGSGIAVLIAHEMAKLKQKNPDKLYRLNLIDVNEKALEGLQKYVKTQTMKVAEKTIVPLRAMYESREDLVENADIINAFIDDTMSTIRPATNLEMAKNSKIVFEAILEDENVKTKILKTLHKLCGEDTVFFTNTSSIPIGLLDEKIGLNGRIIGYHFYNPPIVQKLVELITAKTTNQELQNISVELGQRLRKKLISSNDIAGFIGNGHFIRDGLYAMEKVKRLKKKHSFAGAIYIMNRVSQDFLVRPMGIFQLIDYVGLDVFQCILKVMKKHLKDKKLKSKFIDLMVEKKVLGGQRPDGSQKDGFFKYEKNRPSAVYDLEKGEYVTIAPEWDVKIGELPAGHLSWKKLLGESDKEGKLSNYFSTLKGANTLGANLAKEYFAKTKTIAEELIQQGVAKSAEDVNAVLMNGFFWIYGPINNY